MNNRERMIWALIFAITIVMFEFLYINKPVRGVKYETEVHEYFYGDPKHVEQAYHSGYLHGVVNVYNNDGMFDHTQAIEDSLTWRKFIMDEKWKIR